MLDLGTADVVDLRPVAVQARPGDTVVIRSGNPGRGPDDESPVHHLFTSAAPDAVPPLFVPVGAGRLPNPGVWGVCAGGDARDARTGCPIPPIEGPRAYDGRSYFSLGALLPGETREIPLAPDLPFGSYRFSSAIHPGLYVDVQVVRDPVEPAALPPVDAVAATAAARRAARPSADGDPVVLLGPGLADHAVEVLTAVPATVRIPVNGTVTWRVPGRSPHTVELGTDPEHPPSLAHTTAADTTPRLPPGGRWDGTGVVRSGVLSRDRSVRRTLFSIVFTRPGTYRASNRFHQGLTTVVHVG